MGKMLYNMFYRMRHVQAIDSALKNSTIHGWLGCGKGPGGQMPALDLFMPSGMTQAFAKCVCFAIAPTL